MKWLQGVAAVTLVGLGIYWFVGRGGDDTPPARMPSDEIDLKHGLGEVEPATMRDHPPTEVAPRVPVPGLDHAELSPLGHAVALMHPDAWLAACPVPQDAPEGAFRIGLGQGYGYIHDGELVAVLPGGEGSGQVKSWDAVVGNLQWTLDGGNPGACVFSEPASQPVNLRVIDFDGHTIEGATIGGCPPGTHITSGPEGVAVAQLPEGAMCWATVWREEGDKVAWSKPQFGEPGSLEELVLHVPKEEDLKTWADHAARMRPAVDKMAKGLAEERAAVPDVAVLRAETTSQEVERALAVLDRYTQAELAAWAAGIDALRKADPEAVRGLAEGRYNP